jgi:hypothetical protein
MGKMWFRPKAYGYGAGLPIAWQGWVVLAVFLLAVFGLHWLVVTYVQAARQLVIQTAGLVILVAAVMLIAKAKTEGGWHWRS